MINFNKILLLESGMREEFNQSDWDEFLQGLVGKNQKSLTQEYVNCVESWLESPDEKLGWIYEQEEYAPIFDMVQEEFKKDIGMPVTLYRGLSISKDSDFYEDFMTKTINSDINTYSLYNAQSWTTSLVIAQKFARTDSNMFSLSVVLEYKLEDITSVLYYYNFFKEHHVLNMGTRHEREVVMYTPKEISATICDFGIMLDQYNILSSGETPQDILIERNTTPQKLYDEFIQDKKYDLDSVLDVATNKYNEDIWDDDAIIKFAKLIVSQPFINNDKLNDINKIQKDFESFMYFIEDMSNVLSVDEFLNALLLIHNKSLFSYDILQSFYNELKSFFDLEDIPKTMQTLVVKFGMNQDAGETDWQTGKEIPTTFENAGEPEQPGQLTVF